MAEEKALVVFYSYSGNTKRIAQKIQEMTNGDLFEIKPIKEYPKNYNDIVNLAQIEKRDNIMPELRENINISEYNTIYIGTPVWWYTFATPVKTFLSQNDFSGKVIKPFCTHGGGGASNTYTDIEKLCPTAIIKEGFTSFENSAKDTDIANWINQ